MNKFRICAAGLILALAYAAAAVANPTLDITAKTALQAGMQQHIERTTVNGLYLHVDLATGATRSLHPVNAHPMILRMGENFVLCAAFRDADGKTIPVDYYMAKRGDRFVVFQTEVENRGPLERLMKAGKVAQAD